MIGRIMYWFGYVSIESCKTWGDDFRASFNGWGERVHRQYRNFAQKIYREHDDLKIAFDLGCHKQIELSDKIAALEDRLVAQRLKYEAELSMSREAFRNLSRKKKDPLPQPLRVISPFGF